MKILPGQSYVNWHEVKSYEDILFHSSQDGIARIAINRPEKRNAFRPKTIDELLDAFNFVRLEERMGVVLLTGAGPDKNGKSQRYQEPAFDKWGKTDGDGNPGGAETYGAVFVLRFERFK